MKRTKPFGYYPGCSGMGTSVEYDRSTRAVAAVLGIQLQDIEDWSCCGSTPAHTIDHGLSTALTARNFVQAEKQGLMDVLTPCPSCLKNLKSALHHMQSPVIGPKATKLLGGDTVNEEHTAKSVLQIIHEEVDRDILVNKVRRPLAGIKVVPYYGCLMSRPKPLMQFGDEEYPMAMDDLLAAAGAEVIPFPLKTDCCGASMGIPLNEAVTRLSGRIIDLAVSLGADVIAAACPLCQMNLDLRQSQVEKAAKKKYNIPVMYYTQLLGLAFNLPEKDLGLDKLVVSPQPVLDKLAAARDAAKKAKAEDAA
ncbi:CoB--CoM heterodisulfide reductase [uncultured delta proteobacterium]|uniref:CoB--CoM heterodisulfide reductase n=1 Tax=uncultured delta proteobacterium TaxID=34034 RepID=A0A212IUT3_9DELT|nr:CoB--CoM heterodisulfide reductase [uncultured delta proteobacterium]